MTGVSNGTNGTAVDGGDDTGGDGGGGIDDGGDDDDTVVLPPDVVCGNICSDDQFVARTFERIFLATNSFLGPF